MSANWVGPGRVIQVLSDYVFRVQHLITQETEEIHVSRINRYADTLIGTPAKMKEIAEFSDRIWYSADEVKDIREQNGSFEALISWKGLSSSGDSWEPLLIMFEDVSSKVRAFFKRKRFTSASKRAKNFLKL